MHEVTVVHYPHVVGENWLLLERSAKHRGVALVTWEPHQLQVSCDDDGARVWHAGRPAHASVVLHRTVGIFAGLAMPALDLLRRSGVAVLNEPSAAYRTRDKLATTLLLRAAGLAVVASVGFDRSYLGTLPGLPADTIVVKPAHGVRGEGVELHDGGRPLPAQEWQLAEKLPGWYETREHYVAQPFLRTGGRDLRAYVVGGSCVALMQRQARDGEFRANLAQGATGTALPLHHHAARLAVDAAAACGLDHGGVDLLEDRDGLLRVLEVDAWAGFAGITAVTGHDVAGALLDLAQDRAEAP